MILLSITILIYISSLEFLWVPIMIFSSGYQPIYCAFPPYCALLCHNYSRLFYYTFNISSLLFQLIFYPSVNLRSVRLNIGSDEFWSFRLIFGMSCDCCAIRSKPGLTNSSRLNFWVPSKILYHNIWYKFFSTIVFLQ